jgi:diguanylate cyclase (GGDEF)-like protein
MKSPIQVFALLLAFNAVSHAMTKGAPPVVLTSIAAIHSLSNQQAANSLPVAIEATVTYYMRGNKDLFLQDGDLAIYAEVPLDANLVPGDRVLLRGKTRASFRPDLLADSVTFLHHGDPPAPLPANFKQMVHAELDCMRVTVHGVVRSSDIVTDANLTSIYMQLLVDGGYIDATVNSSDASALRGLLDSEVNITGVVAGKFDSKNQLTGILLEVPDLSGVKVIKRASIGPDSLPVTPMDEILQGSYINDLSQRVRVRGTITYYQPGSTIVLQDGAKSLMISTQYEKPLRIGDLADATGFPEVHDFALSLSRGEIRDLSVPSLIKPRTVTSDELASGANAFDLVSVEGRVLMAERESAEDEYILTSGGHLFSAIYRHPDPTVDTILPPMRQIPVGSKVRITGICMLYYGADPFQGPVAFDVLMRNFDDVAVVANPPLLNVKNLVYLIGFLLLIVVAGGARGWAMERRIRQQNAASAYIERRRGQILEDINGSRPLAEIIEQITELVSFRLKGAPSWCQIDDGAQLGNCPSQLNAMRIVQHEIPARAGSRLGTIFAAFDPLEKARPSELDVLANATGLATLAIETRRLYSDMVRRSEFDLLTDIHNRFSLEKRLDALIDEAREKAGVFGLIYIDLDRFKEVNDLYGHQTGDIFLQEVALRMKRQLRSMDTLARLGGDEFAVLVPVVRNRQMIEEIAIRLEHSFDDPFWIEGHCLRGSASIGIALYPEDGATKDTILKAADAVMYSSKNIKRKAMAVEKDGLNLGPMIANRS